jgi:hypothetical protein
MEMSKVFYIDGMKVPDDEFPVTPWELISSPDENTPAFENLETGFKSWCLKHYVLHRLTGPARILPNGACQFYLNGKNYETVKEWIVDHPNPDLYFHKIGVFTETDKILWFLQN